MPGQQGHDGRVTDMKAGRVRSSPGLRMTRL
ncbi:hypothetical protein EMIT047CA2_40014 [Pseudomonas soli]